MLKYFDFHTLQLRIALQHVLIKRFSRFRQSHNYQLHSLTISENFRAGIWGVYSLFLGVWGYTRRSCEIFEIWRLLSCLKFIPQTIVSSFSLNPLKILPPVLTFISFSTSARPQGFKLHHNLSTTNKQQHFYFTKICRLWNALPLIYINQPVDIIRNTFLESFYTNFNPFNPHTLHSWCITNHFTINYILLYIDN